MLMIVQDIAKEVPPIVFRDPHPNNALVVMIALLHVSSSAQELENAGIHSEIAPLYVVALV